jgi:hypothetical protein
VDGCYPADLGENEWTKSWSRHGAENVRIIRERGRGWYDARLGLFSDRTDEWVEDGHLGNSG